MVPGRKETRASFPHHPLLFLYTFYLSFTFPSCFSLSPSLSPLLHCFPMLLSLLAFLRVVPHTGPPPGLRNTPSTCPPGSDMSSSFPNPVQRKQGSFEPWLAGGDLERYKSLLRPLPILMFDSYEFMTACQ